MVTVMLYETRRFRLKLKQLNVCANNALHSDPKSYASFVALRYNATKAT